MSFLFFITDINDLNDVITMQESILSPLQTNYPEYNFDMDPPLVPLLTVHDTIFSVPLLDILPVEYSEVNVESNEYNPISDSI